MIESFSLQSKFLIVVCGSVASYFHVSYVQLLFVSAKILWHSFTPTEHTGRDGIG
jgi:hypothetical protein